MVAFRFPFSDEESMRYGRSVCGVERELVEVTLKPGMPQCRSPVGGADLGELWLVDTPGATSRLRWGKTNLEAGIEELLQHGWHQAQIAPSLYQALGNILS